MRVWNKTFLLGPIEWNKVTFLWHFCAYMKFLWQRPVMTWYFESHQFTIKGCLSLSLFTRSRGVKKWFWRQILLKLSLRCLLLNSKLLFFNKNKHRTLRPRTFYFLRIHYSSSFIHYLNHDALIVHSSYPLIISVASLRALFKIIHFARLWKIMRGPPCVKSFLTAGDW